MTALAASQISVRVKDSQLLDRVSFTVEKGEWLSIIGPNGAGKSTLLRAIAGAAHCDGSVTVLGEPLAELGLKERAKLVAWVPQTPTIPGGMGVIDYVLLGRTPYLHPLANPSKDDLAAAHETLRDLQLESLEKRLVETLSGGERQRVVIARALVQDTPVILLDEPTSALDLGHQQEVLQLLDRLRANGERTIISTMHDLTLAGHFADRVLMLANGSVVAEGPAHHVLTEANIDEHYGASVTIADVDGTIVISPKIPKTASHHQTSS